MTKNVLARAHKKLQRGRNSEIYSLTLKKQDKTKVELSVDMVSILASNWLHPPPPTLVLPPRTPMCLGEVRTM